VLGFDRFEADTVSLHGTIERLRSHQNRTFEKPTVLHFFEAVHILANGEREQDDERCAAAY
jgi:hypothetical protein